MAAGSGVFNQTDADDRVREMTAGMVDQPSEHVDGVVDAIGELKDTTAARRDGFGYRKEIVWVRGSERGTSHPGL